MKFDSIKLHNINMNDMGRDKNPYRIIISFFHSVFIDYFRERS